MSTFQPQQQQPQIQPQQQQQPVVVYPNSGTNQAAPGGSSHHSDGSFGTVFIVLAVIAVVSAIACLLGRLCRRKVVHNQKPKQSHHKQSRTAPKEIRPDVEFGNRSFRPGSRGEGVVEFGNINNPNLPLPKEGGGGGGGGGGGDIEFGFDSKRVPPNGIKTNGNRENRGHVVFEQVNGEVKHHGDPHHHDGGPRANHV